MLKCLMGSLHWINKGKYKIDRDVATQWSSCKGIAFLATKESYIGWTMNERRFAMGRESHVNILHIPDMRLTHNGLDSK